MHALYARAFEREMGCTDDELRAWLPGASRLGRIEWRGHGADIVLDGRRASIDWQVHEPRRIALLVIPRLQVRFDARDVDDVHWQPFMRHFDLYTQRGGG